MEPSCQTAVPVGFRFLSGWLAAKAPPSVASTAAQAGDSDMCARAHHTDIVSAGTH
jgi:hypothetical protein